MNLDRAAAAVRFVADALALRPCLDHAAPIRCEEQHEQYVHLMCDACLALMMANDLATVLEGQARVEAVRRALDAKGVRA